MDRTEPREEEGVGKGRWVEKRIFYEMRWHIWRVEAHIYVYMYICSTQIWILIPTTNNDIGSKELYIAK